MGMRALVCSLLILLHGCAIISDHRVAAGCQVADGLTTWYALKHGAVEANPLLNGVSPGAILAIKLMFAYIVYKALDPKGKPQTGVNKFAGGAITVMGCVPAINNVSVIQGLP